MKQLVYLLALTLLAACSKEPAQSPGPQPQGGHTLAFTYPNYRTAESRASVPAQDWEKAVYDLGIFAFRADGSYIGQLAAGEDADYTETDTGGTTTIEATKGFIGKYAGQTVVFYFVGNNARSLSNSTAAATQHIASFSGTETDFRELLTVPLGSNWDNTKAEYIKVSPTAGGLLMTARAEVTIMGKTVVPVMLKRRTARFDLINPAPDNLIIEGIYISDAKVQGPMFGDARGPFSIPARSLEQIDRPGVADNAHVSYAVEKDAQSRDVYRAAGMFYLYPTSLTETSITVRGYLGSVRSDNLYSFPVVGNIDILANNRYTLKFDEYTTNIIINVGDYEEGGTIVITENE